MEERYNAFSFVDRIDSFEPGKRGKGRFRIPDTISEFPPGLIAEAIGQTAAWVSMDYLDYRLRPVAGIAAEIKFWRDVKVGKQLDLEVEIDTCSDSDVSYNGRALVNDEVVVELFHSLGPMLPMEEFDEPGDMRQRFRLLCGDGAPPGRYGGVSGLALVPSEQAAANELVASLHIPEDAPFFGDHFPRRPVFPATLLFDIQAKAATRLAIGSGLWPADTPPLVRRLLDLKMRSFISPGQNLEIRIALTPPEQGIASARMTSHLDGRRVSHARAEIGPRQK